MTADGAMTLPPAPIPAGGIAFDGTGALWLASDRHLVRTTPTALSAQGCDERPPRVTVTPRVRRISLAALRRGRLRVRTSEPARVHVAASYEFGRRTASDEGRRHTPPWRYRVPPRRLRSFERALAREERVRLTLEIGAPDFEGNLGSRIPTWTTTP